MQILAEYIAGADKREFNVTFCLSISRQVNLHHMMREHLICGWIGIGVDFLCMERKVEPVNELEHFSPGLEMVPGNLMYGRPIIIPYRQSDFNCTECFTIHGSSQINFRRTILSLPNLKIFLSSKASENINNNLPDGTD